MKTPKLFTELEGGQILALFQKMEEGEITADDLRAVLRGEKEFILAEPQKPTINFPALILNDPTKILSGNNLREQVRELCTIAGETNVLSPWQACERLGMQVPEDLDSNLIKTPLEVIKKLVESEAKGFFSWRASKLLPKTKKPKLTPISTKWLWEKATPLYKKERIGEVLCSAGQPGCWYSGEQFFTARDTAGKVINSFLPRPGWAWVTVSPVSGTKGKKYPHQIETLANFFMNMMDGVPEKLAVAFQEWGERKDDLFTLTDRDWVEAARQLSALAISSLRRNPAEILWDVALMRLVHNVKLLELVEYDRTSALSSDGHLVHLGDFDGSGGRVPHWRPDAVNGNLGACLSAGLESLNP